MENIPAFLASLFTALFGLLAILKPELVSKIASITPKGKTGISEIRAVYGGWILGLAGYALWVQTSDVYFCLGFGWLGAGLLRIVSILIDKSYASKNIRITVIELVFALALLIRF